MLPSSLKCTIYVWYTHLSLSEHCMQCGQSQRSLLQCVWEKIGVRAWSRAVKETWGY